ncbi:MAG: pilus assembly protein PilM [Patescibacteria group bacterium]
MQSVYGLDISDHSAEMVSLRKHRGSVLLDRFGSAEIPPGVIVRGAVEDPKKLAEILTALFDRVCGPRRGRIRVALSLPETVVFSQVFKLPAGLEAGMAAKAAAQEAFETFPMSFDRIGADTAVIERSENTQSVLYAAAERTVVDRYLAALRDANAEIDFVDIESHALARALVPRNEAKPVLVVDMGDKTTIVAVVEGNAVSHSASIPIGGNHLTTAIETKLNIPLEKAEELKRRAGFDPSLDEGRIFFIMQSPMMELIEEIRRVIAYLQKNGGRSVETLILAGGVSLTPFIVDYLASNLSSVQIRRGEPMKAIALGSGLKADEFVAGGILFATAIGVAMRGLGLSFGPNLDLRKTGDMSASRKPKNILVSVRSLIVRMKETLPAPAVKSSSKITMIAAVIFALVALGVAGSMAYSVVRRLRGGGTGAAPVPTAASAQGPVSVTVTISADQPANEAGNILRARSLSIELTQKSTVTATGVKASVEGRASGDVTIENTTSRSQTLTATTRMLSKEGVLFRLASAAVVPAKGSVEARVAADKPGSQGDIGPTTFTIPGLSNDLQTKITARSDAPMTGGGGSAVTDGDLADAKKILTESLQKQALAKFGENLENGEAVLPELTLHDQVSWNGPKVGSVGKQFDASLTVRFATLVLPADEIMKRLQAQLSVPAELAVPQYAVSSLTTGARQAVIRAEAEVRR